MSSSFSNSRMNSDRSRSPSEIGPFSSNFKLSPSRYNSPQSKFNSSTPSKFNSSSPSRSGSSSSKFNKFSPSKFNTPQRIMSPQQRLNPPDIYAERNEARKRVLSRSRSPSGKFTSPLRRMDSSNHPDVYVERKAALANHRAKAERKKAIIEIMQELSSELNDIDLEMELDL